MDNRIILTVKRLAVFITKAQGLVVLVYGGALVDTSSVRWCGSAGYHSRREHRTDQEGEDSEERAHLVKAWKFERRQKGKKAQKSLTPRTSNSTVYIEKGQIRYPSLFNVRRSVLYQSPSAIVELGPSRAKLGYSRTYHHSYQRYRHYWF